MIDLHTHTRASDGSLKPTELVREAARAGLTTLAITDHDTVAGVPEALEAGGHHEVAVIAGVELSVDRPGGGSAHILGLWIDPMAPAIRQAVSFSQRAREARNEKILRRLEKKGMPLSRADLKALKEHGPVGRSHIVRALLRKGYCTRDRAWREILGADGWAYVERERLGPRDAFQAITASGGLPVLAHPGLLAWDDQRLQQQLADWARQGLGGVEADYPRHSIQRRDQYVKMAREVGLQPTGGSDFHGLDIKPNNQLGHGAGGQPISERLLPTHPC